MKGLTTVEANLRIYGPKAWAIVKVDLLVNAESPSFDPQSWLRGWLSAHASNKSPFTYVANSDLAPTPYRLSKRDHANMIDGMVECGLLVPGRQGKAPAPVFIRMHPRYAVWSGLIPLSWFDRFTLIHEVSRYNEANKVLLDHLLFWFVKGGYFYEKLCEEAGKGDDFYRSCLGLVDSALEASA